MRKLAILIFLCLAVHPLSGQQSGMTPMATCTANTALTKCLGVSPYLAVSGDWSTAINQAMTDLSTTGGTIFGCGVYPVNGSPLDPTGANALLKVPTIASVSGFTNITITFQGCQDTTPNISALTGMILQTSVNTSGVNFIAGYVASGSTFGHFTAVKLVMNHTNIVSTVAVPAINLLNASNINAMMLNDVLISGTSCTNPVGSTGGTGLITPSVANNFEVVVQNVVISCMANAALIHEHTQMSNLWMGANHNCLQFDSQDPVNNGNAIGGDQIWMQSCVNYVLGPSSSNPTSVSLTRVEMESDPGTGFNFLDASNLLHGHIAYKKTSPSTAATFSGAANVSLTNLNDSTETISSATNIVQTINSTHANGTVELLTGSASGVDSWGFGSLSSAASVGHAFGVLDNTAGNWAGLWNLQGVSGPGYFVSPNFMVLGWSSSIDVTTHTPDTGLSRGAANVIDAGNGTAADRSAKVQAGSLNLTSYTVSTLPSASTAGAGTQVIVSDATTFTPGTCTGGGSDYMIAVSNGTTWSCH